MAKPDAGMRFGRVRADGEKLFPVARAGEGDCSIHFAERFDGSKSSRKMADSEQVAVVGLKKKSERAKSTRNNTTATAATNKAA